MPELTGQPFLQIIDNVYKSGKKYEAAGMSGDIIHDGIPALCMFF
jgi:hypothetical protein